jgi:PAS domain S-box-containing protein
MELINQTLNPMEVRKPSHGIAKSRAKRFEFNLLRLSDSMPPFGFNDESGPLTHHFYRSLIEQTLHGLALFEIKYDSLGKPYDFLFIEINPAFEQLVGHKRHQIVRNNLSLTLGNSEPAWMGLCLRAAQKGEKETLRNYFPTIHRYLDIEAFCPESGRLAVIVSDITEHEQIKKSLLSSEEGFRNITENAGYGILIGYAIDSPFIYANQQAAKLTGYSIDELMKIQPAQLLEPSEIPKIQNRIQKRLQGKPSPNGYMTTIVRQNGQVFPVEVYGARVIWNGRHAVMTQFCDISRHKQAERQLENVNRDLECRVQERTAELTRIARELEEKKEELLRHKKDLERANRELVQTNTALSVLARNIDRSHGEFEQKIAGLVSSRIMPVIEELRQAKIPEKNMAALDVMATYLTDLTPGCGRSQQVVACLSPMEMRVAMMIKKGFNSNQIGMLLHISLDTVKTHRRSIRRKLGLCKSSINLSSYLKFKISEQYRPPAPPWNQVQ